MKKAIDKLIELCGPHILLDSDRLIYGFEDVIPLSADKIQIIRRNYTKELGQWLFDALSEKQPINMELLYEVFNLLVSDHSLDDLYHNISKLIPGISLSGPINIFDDSIKHQENLKENITKNAKDIEKHRAHFKKCFSLLSNVNNHCAACTALSAEADSLENPCATIMLAFMYYCGWVKGNNAEIILMQAYAISNPNEWLRLAEKLKTNNREQAAAYYIGHAMVNKDSAAFKMAGFLGVRLENYEVTKACFKYAGESDAAAKSYYDGLCVMPSEAAFKRWAAIQNNKR